MKVIMMWLFIVLVVGEKHLQRPPRNTNTNNGKILKVLRLYKVAKYANYLRRTAQLMGAVSAGTSLNSGFFNGFGSEKTQFESLITSVNTFVQITTAGLTGVDWLLMKAAPAQFLLKGGAIMEEMAKPGVLQKIQNTFQTTSNTALKNECEFLLNLRQSINAYAQNVLRQPKLWFVSERTFNAAVNVAHPYQKFHMSGFFIEESKHVNNVYSLYSKTVGSNNVLAKYKVDGDVVEIIKSEATIPTGMNEFKLIDKAKVKLTTTTTAGEKSLIVGRNAAGDACILPTYCFTGNTLIHTPTGAVPFEQLQDGAEILTYNTDNKMSLTQTIGKIVRSQATKLVKIFTGGELVMATPEHPIYESTNGWTLAGNLRKGMGLLLATGLSLSIDSVATIDTTCTVYNCDVPVTHTYYVGANGILAHNADVCNKLVEAALNKLGKGYDAAGVKAGLEEVYAQYLKALGGIGKEKEAIEGLAKLVNGAASPEQLGNFLKALNTDAKFAELFAKHIREEITLLDDFAANGRTLELYENYLKNPEQFWDILRESEELNSALHNLLKSRKWKAIFGDARAYEKFVADYLKGLNPKIVTQVHVDVTVTRGGVTETRRLVLDNLEKIDDGITVLFKSTDAKYSTVKDFTTNAEYLSACTDNQKWFYQALKDGKVTKIKNASTKKEMFDNLGIRPNNDIPLNLFEAYILPSTKGNKQSINFANKKNVLNL